MYFCKNCGEAYTTDEAVICVKCGIAKGQGTNYCHHCGMPMANDADVCMNCGVPSRDNASADASGLKSRSTAGLLGIFLGCFGAHNFYLGFTGRAIAQLVITIVGFVLCCVIIGIIPVMVVCIWTMIESVKILSGKINNDADGKPLVD